MYFSHVRIDGPKSLYDKILPVLKHYAVACVTGFEFSKKSKKPHFHIHMEHKQTICSVRKGFRRMLPDLARTQLTVSAMRSTVVKNVMYCIKNLDYWNRGIPQETIDEALAGIKKYKRQKGMRLTEKCVEEISEKLEKTFTDVEDLHMKIKLKRPVIKLALEWFKNEDLNYPLKSWMDKMYIQLLMHFDLVEDAIDYYE